MTSHRRPKDRGRAGTTARTAAGLALAGAASMTVFGEAGHAEPRLTADEARARVDRLYEEAEQATERYNGAKEKADTTTGRIERLQDELARRTERLNRSRDGLGSLATAQYRSGGIDPAVQLALASSPGDYLERAGMLDRMSSRQNAALRALSAQRRDIEQLRTETEGELAELRRTRAELARHKRTVERRLASARQLLGRLTADGRAEALSSGGHGSADPARAGRAATGSRTGLAPAAAPNARAARAVSFAYDSLGLPYVWGATGPSAYDCSGFTQAAWRSGGVSLPRTTYTQINAGTRVSRSQLEPGDLVFFYSGISHVGLYVGNGMMIHAPRTGDVVKLAPVDQMPFAGAARPA
ncbi:NlpC/P60 family protein [Actinacidiphila glaucinigra]|uniref:C40 family peptidase n=1 Tax=Actinacidiphila glaucinigra TaxID=235986 RepID=UPI0036A9209F